MTQVDGFGDKVGFIWAVADLLRGDYKAHEYGQVILPLTVLRRLDAVLAPSKQAVIDRAATLAGKIDNPEQILLRTAGQPFYCTSPLDFRRLLDDAPNIAANLRTYIAGYSPGAVEVLREYRFDEHITRLDNAGVLFHVVARFADVDLHPDRVPNEAMGYIFEELLRKFSEMSNETAGEHFTPREVIRMMVNLLFSEDDDALRGAAPIRSMFDPACGTGGMLSIAQEHLTALNPNAALEVFGQELNAETWAIARSDLMIKGQDPSRIKLGNSLLDDQFTGRTFDYMLANPPFGVDWKRIQKQITDEHKNLGTNGRFGAGLPRVSDGSLLFLQHMISKMKPAKDGGSRLAIVFSGSPLFSGAAASGESEIRRWIIENDMLEGIVALPDQLFYNTGISTYFWIVTNRKTPERRGKVVLLDARNEFAKMRKSLGDKRKYIPDDKINEITRLYGDALDLALHDPRVKVFDNNAFGFQRITVERPLRCRWTVTEDTITQALAGKALQNLLGAPNDNPIAQVTAGGGDKMDAATERLDMQLTEYDGIVTALNSLLGTDEPTQAGFGKRLLAAVRAAGITISTPAQKTIIAAAQITDQDADPVLDRQGNPLPDPDLRDNENVPLVEAIDDYLTREVLPHVPDAWVDLDKTKIGYEIPFTRHFYTYTPPRPLTEIDADIDKVEAEIQDVLRQIAR